MINMTVNDGKKGNEAEQKTSVGLSSVEQISPSEQRRVFNIKEARELLPLIYHITELSHQRVKKMLNRLEAVKGKNVIMVNTIEGEISAEMEKWQSKLQRLGVSPKGMWLADFDNGTGFFCWKYPETEIRFFHGYKDGFSRRIEIQ